jgi:hypothetical protein
MALSPMQTALCNKLATDYGSLVAPVKTVKDAFKSQMGQLDSFVRGMSFSNPLDLDAALLDFTNRVEDMLPGADFASMEELAAFMAACPYLADKLPASNVAGTSNGIFDNIRNFINDLTPSFPEFGAGGIADGLNSLLSGVGIPGGANISDLLDKADKLANCLSALCGPAYSGDVTDITNDLNSLYSELNIIDSGPNKGKFDFDYFYTASGLSASQQHSLSIVTSSIGEQKRGATTAITNSLNAVKQFNKGGYF